MASLVHHLHAFVKDVELTEEEWAAAIGFLTRTGHMCDDVRQEFILLSDVLGVSMLVETINHRAGGAGTESTVLGPFHMVESPPRELGDDIALDGKGTPCLVAGPGHRPRRRADPGRQRRRLAGQRRRLLRRAATGRPARAQPARTVHRRRRGALPLPLGRAPRTTRSRTTARSASCSRRPAATPTGPPTCTSSCPRPGIGR